MDAIEEKKHHGHSHRGSNSSVESFSFSASPQAPRKSLSFARQSLDERPREVAGYAHGESDAERLAKKLKGRLRAWTVGKDREVKPYEGT
jgi:hypothetical protein